MTLDGAASLFVENRSLIAETWNFFLSAHLAIFGLLFVVRRGKARILNIVFLPAYLAFMFINYNAQVDNYMFSSAIAQQLSAAELMANVDKADSIIAGFRVGWIRQYLVHIYVAACVFSSSLIFASALFPVRQPE